MKANRYQHRFYRNWLTAKSLQAAHIVARETDLYILTDKKLDQNFVRERIRSYRWEIENYIDKDRRFLTALKPIEVELDAPAIVKKMSESAKAANVGPMSAVAGAIAEFLAKDLLKEGFKDVIVENGGDIFLKCRRDVAVGIYAGRSKFSRNLNLKLKAKDMPLGVCASSGTIGHSLSFGRCDCVIVVSKSASLADAVATATGNRVNSAKDLRTAADFACSLKGIEGVLIIIKNKLIAVGKIELLKAKNP